MMHHTSNATGSRETNLLCEDEHDFVVRLHNDGFRKEAIARAFARKFHGHDRPDEADLRFVDEALTNLEG